MKFKPTITLLFVIIAILFTTKKGIGQKLLHSDFKKESLTYSTGVVLQTVCLPKLCTINSTAGSGFMNGCDGRSLQNEKNILTLLTKSVFREHLGIVCKTELILDKITPIALRFRLGSLDYVNWMEQKPNAIKPGR